MLILTLILQVVVFSIQPLSANLSESQNDVSVDETFIITGDKITDDILTNPSSLTQFSRKKIMEAGVRDLRDLADMTANLHITGPSSSRYMTPYIRGQGNEDLNLPGDVSVMFYLDEVPLPRYAFQNELVDLASIKVLRGPQGTLFGKNTQAGAVLLTSQPASSWEKSEIKLAAGNLNSQSFQATSNLWSSSDLISARTSVKLSSRDGWIEDTILQKKLGEMTSQSFHQTLEVSPTDKTKLTVRIGAQREDGTDPFFVSRNQAQYPITGQSISPDYRRDLLLNSFKLEHTLGNTVLTSISAFNYYDYDVVYDEADLFIARDTLVRRVGPVLADQLINDPDSLYREITEYDRQFFQELRMRILATKNLELTTGLNFSHNHYQLKNKVDTFGQFGPNLINQNVHLTSTSYSLFGQARQKISRNWFFSLGLRANYDEKKYDSRHSSNLLSSYEQQSRSLYREMTGTTSLEYRWDSTSTSYFSISRGHQPGGYPSFQFNNYINIAQDQAPFSKSTSWAYELGHKVRAIGGRVQLSTALYLQDIKDKQIRVRDPQTNLSYYENLDTQIFGGEFESSLNLAQVWDVGMSLGYTNASFKNTVEGNNLTLSKNSRPANIPYWNSSSFIQYQNYHSTIQSLLTARVSYHLTGSRFGDNTNQTRLATYGIWNGRISLERKSFSLNFDAYNFFDKTYESQAYYYASLQTEVSSPGLPRMYQVSVSYNF